MLQYINETLSRATENDLKDQTGQLWHAILNCDMTYNGKFYDQNSKVVPIRDENYKTLFTMVCPP